MSSYSFQSRLLRYRDLCFEYQALRYKRQVCSVRCPAEMATAERAKLAPHPLRLPCHRLNINFSPTPATPHNITKHACPVRQAHFDY